MIRSCDLNNIVTLGYCPDDGTPTSGFTLLQAGGMNIRNFANIATDSSGIEMAMEKKTLAINKFRNDFIGALAANNVLTSVANPDYDTAMFKTDSQVGSSSSGRGTTICKVRQKSQMRELFIKGVEIFPVQSGSGTLQIIDGLNIYSFPITFIGGQSNFYDDTQLADLPYSVQSNFAKVLVIADGIDFYSSYIQCKTGCHGAPNPCGWAEGWNGSAVSKHEGYGTNVVFGCECNYDKVICGNPKLYGELIWLQWQMMIYDEHYKSNRFNGFVTYNKETIDEVVMPQLQSQYNEKWGYIQANLLNILKVFKDDCLNCKGIRYATNI